jgi:hypothetical protein
LGSSKFLTKPGVAHHQRSRYARESRYIIGCHRRWTAAATSSPPDFHEGLDFLSHAGILDTILHSQNKKELADGTTSAGKKQSCDHGLPVGARRPFDSMSSKKSVSHGCLS